ncbi:hypothetical protein LJC17_02640 [Acholeplasma sp. OttesenSCG-928-E16]|nr:hypothetical protein [Acholeplasma sp. OttesenSCG-928-E16]
MANKSIKGLKMQYFIFLVFSIVFNMIMITVIVLLAMNRDGLFGMEQNVSSIISYVGIGISALAEIYLVYRCIICFKDLNSVRNNTFEEITGTVIRYAKNESETGQQLNDHPIIKEVDSEKTIKLFVSKGTRIQGTYTFIYLKHTKIGIVKIAD